MPLRSIRRKQNLTYWRWYLAVLALGVGLVAATAGPTVPSAAQTDPIAASCGGPNPYFAVTVLEHEEFGRSPTPRSTPRPTARPTARPTMRPGRPNAGPAAAPSYPGPGDPAIVAFNDTPNDAMGSHLKLATQGQVGSVYGLAYDWRRGQLYAGAYQKRMALYGAGGTGGIYQVDLTGGGVRRWAQLAAGPITHDIATGNDAVAAGAVGKVGLGDLGLGEDGSELFAVNLFDRRIYRFQVPGGTLLGTFAHGASTEPWAANARPFGLGVHGGWLFHGVVDSRQNASLPGALRAVVYRSRSDGSEMSEVIRVALDYPRSYGQLALPWVPWDDQATAGRLTASQPMLVDIEFRPSGEPILGFRQRQADMVDQYAIGSGDILPTHAEADGAGHLWAAITQPEHYADDLTHAESSWGGLAAFPGLDAVVSNAVAPLDSNTGGALWFDNASGMNRGPHGGKETLYTDALLGNFAKGSGLGDVEALCVVPSAPTPTVLPTSTSTASPAPPTATALPADTPTTTAVPTSPLPPTVPPASPTSPPPTAAPTNPARLRIYLPMAERSCGKSRPPVDVVLVLDMSTSMLRPARDSRPKHVAALSAATRFTELLNLRTGHNAGAGPQHDRVAIAAFNASAWVESPLTDDREALGAALARLPAKIEEFTRLDLALLVGRDALSPVTQTRTPVLVLLTDGLPNRVPPAEDGRVETTVLQAAQAAKAAGIVLWTIGLGEPADINSDLLVAVASRPANYRYAPDALDLADIYGQIARGLGCE